MQHHTADQHVSINTQGAQRLSNVSGKPQIMLQAVSTRSALLWAPLLPLNNHTGKQGLCHATALLDMLQSLRQF